MRKAALSLGFYELFDGLAFIFQREILSGNLSNNPEAILQLNHCVNCLRMPEFKDFRKDIVPFVVPLSHVVTPPPVVKRNQK